MIYKTKTKKSFTIFLLLFIFGCAQDRPEQFVQGQGTDLTSLDNLNEKTFTLTTGEEISSPNDTKFSAISVLGSNNFNYYPIVSYKTNASLLGDIPFRGKPNTTYEIRYHFTPQYLKIYKIGTKESIPFQELPYAEKIPNLNENQIAIPLVGYQIYGYFRIEHIKNSDNEETPQLMEVQELNFSRATHAKIDFKSRETFKPVLKTDLFPAKFFEGEWYYAETLIDQNIDADDNSINPIGGSQAFDSRREEATKVKFIETETLLRAVNSKIDDRLIRDSDLNYSTVFTIPVEHLDLRPEQYGKDTKLRGEVVHDTPWKNKPYMAIDFGSVSTLNADTNIDRLIDLEISSDYIGFTILRRASDVLNENHTSKVKYSFWKIHDRNYEPRRYFYSDQNTFGFFKSVKPYIKNHEIYRKEDVEKNILLQRFNPNNRKIVYHLTRNSSPKYKDMARTAIKEWDIAMKQVDPSFSVVLDESFDVDLGDIRYNKINITEPPVPTSLGGYGPSISDSLTGEILSATANLNIVTYKEGTIDVIRNYIADKTGETKGASLKTALPQEFLEQFHSINFEPQYLSSATSNQGILNPIHSTANASKLMAEIYGSMNVTTNVPTNAPTLSHEKLSPVSIEHERCEYGTSDHYVIKQIDNYCPELNVVIEFKKNDHIPHSEELSYIQACADKIVQPIALGALLHEIGHNFGLRHNFLGATDKENFSENGETSSIMDYTAESSTRGSKLGPYDIAALRFGYNDKVELISGNLKKIDPTLSLQDNFKGQEKIKPFKYCTDEDVLMNDPLCQRHIKGTTPEEVVDYLVQSFWTDVTYLVHRGEKYWSTQAVVQPLIEQSRTSYLTGRYLLQMKRIYDEWRYHLSRFVDVSNGYLENQTVESYQKTLEQMKADTYYSKYYKQYYPAIRKIFDFYKMLVFLPNKYCVIKSSAGVELLEFKKLQSMVFNATENSIDSCFHSDAQKFLNSQYTASVLDAFGFSTDSIRYSMDPSDSYRMSLDIVGIKPIRKVALLLLTYRDTDLIKNRTIDVYPNFLDEPNFKEEIQNALMDRILNGVTVTKELSHMTNFNSEKDILAYMISGFKRGLSIPKSFEKTIARTTPFRALFTSEQSQIENLVKNGVIKQEHILQVGSYFVAPLNANLNNETVRLIQKYKRIKELENTSPVSLKPEEALAQLKDIISVLPQKDKVDTLSVKVFIAIYQKINQILSSHPILIEYIQTSPQGARFVGPISKINFMASLISGLFQEIPNEQKANILQMPLLNFLNKIPKEKLPEQLQSINFLDVISDITQESTQTTGENTIQEEDLTGLNELIQRANEDYNTYQNKVDDYQAQSDLILQILREQ